MGKSKLIATRFDMDLYNRIDRYKLPNSKLIRNAVIQFLDDTYSTKSKDATEDDKDINDEMYNEVYNTLYNIEVTPLRQNLKHLNDKINGLEQNIQDLKEDKLFLQDQLKAQTVLVAAKMPLLARIKMKLLRQHSG